MIYSKKYPILNNLISKIDPYFFSDSFIVSIVLHIFILFLIFISPYIKTSSTILKIKNNDNIEINLENFTVTKKTIIQKQNKINNTQKKEIKYPKPINKKESIKNNVNSNTIEKEKIDKIADYVSKLNTKKSKIDKKLSKKKKDINNKEKRLGGLDKLLASVDNLKKNNKNTSIPKLTEIKKGIQKVETSDNIKNYPVTDTNFVKNQIAISYIDAIKIKLASCWNLDAGAKGIKNMKIVIQTSLTQDGKVI